MPYNQYTTCVPAKSHIKMDQFIQIAIQGLIAGVIGALFVAAAGVPWCLLIVAEIALVIMPLLGYCHWWLEDRLICLGGDFLAIGMLVSVETPGEKKGFNKLDTDYSLNLLIAPNPIGASQATLEASSPYGALVTEQAATRDIGVPFTGTTATDAASGLQCAVLHAEFEGAGVRDTLVGAQIALGLAVLALIVCIAVPGPIGAIIAGILAFLAFLAGLLGALFGLGDTGSPSDVNPALGSLHTNEDPMGADLLVVMGTWVYDAGHNNESPAIGWNELHPIKFCERIGRWNGAWPPDIGDLEVRWKGAVGDATSALTVSDQGRPENGWEVHPIIDGCEPVDAPPPAIK